MFVRVIARAHGGGVECEPVEIEPALVWLASGELRDFEFPVVMHVACRHDAECDERRIEPVMRDGREGDVHAGCPVHEGWWTQRRLAGIAGINKGAVVVRE